MTNKEKTELQKNIVDSLEPRASGRLLLAPRIGKSKLIIDLIKRDKFTSILWVTPSSSLEEGLPKEFELWKAKRYINKLTTSTWMSLDKVTGHYDLVVLDEEQFITEANIKSIRMGYLTYNTFITMTGTPSKHQDKLDLYKKLNLKVLYRIDINKAVDIGLLSNYSIKVIKVPLSSEKNIKAGSKQKPFLTSEISNYEYLSKVIDTARNGSKDKMFRIFNRMRFIKNAPSKLKTAKKLISTLTGTKLIFCGSIDQAESLSENTYHSKTDGKCLRDFKAGKINEIAMVNTGGVGETYKGIDNLIMVQCDSDKNGLTSQKICRTLLSQKNYTAIIWIICLEGTQDEKWVNSTLGSFDKTKIEYVNNKR